jgi:hypothetical protein
MKRAVRADGFGKRGAPARRAGVSKNPPPPGFLLAEFSSDFAKNVH